MARLETSSWSLLKKFRKRNIAAALKSMMLRFSYMYCIAFHVVVFVLISTVVTNQGANAAEAKFFGNTIRGRFV